MTEQNQQILFIDDDSSLREEVCQLFPRYVICGCATISEGVRLALDRVFSLYLLNLSLADGSGLGLCQKIRAFDLNTPIIVMSIHESESYRKYAREVGAHGFWDKGEDLVQLKSIVDRCIYESRVRSFEAKRAEFQAIRDELERQRSEAQAQQAVAREIKEQCRNKRIMLAASRAFESAGGSRADFPRLWPIVQAEMAFD